MSKCPICGAMNVNGQEIDYTHSDFCYNQAVNEMSEESFKIQALLDTAWWKAVEDAFADDNPGDILTQEYIYGQNSLALGRDANRI